MKRHVPAAALLAIAAYGTAGAQPASKCTHESLNVDGTTVVATYCVASPTTAAAGRDLPVLVSERFQAPHGAFSRDATLRFIAGEADSRVIETIPLERLDLKGTIHATLVLRGGLVYVESAILTPGAVTIK